MKLTADMSFDALLEMAAENAAVEAEISRRFGANVAILVVDFSSMRRRMDAFGTVSALVAIRSAFTVYTPAISAQSGRIIKTVADTLFAVFENPVSALEAALDGHARMNRFNQSRPGNIEAGIPHAPIYPKAGLGFGFSLLVPDGNLFGPEVNHAFVLGEDVAENGEILASDKFSDALGLPPSGVGVYDAPHDRKRDSGFSFCIYTDYREESG